MQTKQRHLDLLLVSPDFRDETFGSRLVYLVETCSLLGLVLFTLMRLFLVSSHLGFISSRIVSHKYPFGGLAKKCRCLGPTSWLFLQGFKAGFSVLLFPEFRVPAVSVKN